MKSKTNSRYETKLGFLPKSWKVVILEDYLESLIDYRGKTPKKSKDGVITLSAKSVKMGYIDYSSAYHISEETYASFMVRGFPKKGDVLLTTEAPLGCVATLDRDDVSVAQRLITLRGKEGVLDNQYLKYYLMSAIGQHQLLSRATGSTVQGIKRTEFSKVLLILPPYEDQLYIAKLLSEIDLKIEINDKINESYEKIAQTIFNNWFVTYSPTQLKMSLSNPEINKSEIIKKIMQYISARDETQLDKLNENNPQHYRILEKTAELFPDAMEESEIGSTPKGWKISKFSDISKLVKGKSYKSSELEESKTALVTLKSFKRGGGYRLDGLKEYTGKYKPEQEVFPGDLIIAYTDVTQAADVIGKPAMVIGDTRYDHLVISLDVAVVKPTDVIYKFFLYGIAKTEAFQQQTHAHSTGTTVLHLGKNAVPEFKFSLPSQDLISQYNEIVKPVFESINQKIDDNAKLNLCRKALLPHLLNGNHLEEL